MDKPADRRRGQAGSYFGSIRFFKNLIFLSICILIAVPSALAVKYYRSAEEAAQARESAAAEAFAQVEPEPLPEPPDAETPAEEPAVPAENDSDNEPAPTDTPPAYEALYPDFYAPQPYAAEERAEHTVYLTFDDGPSAQTDRILAILAEKDVKATFFVVGQNDGAGVQRLKSIAAAGHTLGMHSYSDDYGKVYASAEDFLAEFYANFKQLRDAAGVTPTVFRFPGGSVNIYNAGWYRELVGEMTRRGFVPFDWNVSAEDAGGAEKSAEEVTEAVLRGMNGMTRGVVLLHDRDGGKGTVAALPGLIDRLRAQGYTFRAITPETMPVLFTDH